MAENTIKWKKPKQVEANHESLMVEIGKKLEKLRNKKNLTASGLATKLSISRNAYRQMERGEIYFSTYNFLKILDFHSIDLTAFLTTNIEDL